MCQLPNFEIFEAGYFHGLMSLSGLSGLFGFCGLFGLFESGYIF
jgi:hypothetical protein